MKKFIVLSALVAATSTAFVACSSEDDLAQQPKAPETTVDNGSSEGTPLTITFVDATRGTDWTKTTLPSFSLYSVTHSKVNIAAPGDPENKVYKRWLGSYSAQGASSGEPVSNTATSNPGEYTGVFTIAETKWPDESTAYDFYALSDATFAKEAGDVDAEHFDASPRTFTYTVTNDYANQTDLLVASTLNKKATDNGGNVSLDFYHALARIKSVKLMYHASETNTGAFFIIKSMTLKNVASTGTFTFPDADLTATNVNTSWSGQKDLADYTFTFADYELDANDNILVFDETPNANEYENAIKCMHADTKRCGISGFPNFFTVPSKNTDIEFEFPLELNRDNSTDPATYTKADNKGLFLLPQTLAKTVAESDANDKWTFNKNGENTPYLEIRFYGLNVDYTDSPDEFYDEDDFCGPSGVTEMYPDDALTAAVGDHALITNARINYALEHDYLHTVAIPLSQITLEGGKYYTLKAYFNLATDIYSTDGLRIFDGSIVSSGD